MDYLGTTSIYGKKGKPMAMIQGISGRGTVIQGKFITGKPSFAALSPAPSAIQPQMITMQPSPQILGAPQHHPPNMIQQQPAMMPARPKQFGSPKPIGTPKLGLPSTIQRQAAPMAAVSHRPGPPLLGQPNAIQRQPLQSGIQPGNIHPPRQPALLLGQPINPPQNTIQPRAAKPLLGQPINPGAVQPSRGKTGHITVQRVGNGEAYQLPPHLSNFGGGAGQPLPRPVPQKMESFFKTSFADVRVHVGQQAPSIGALAFAHGSNLYFAPGQYSPNTPQGQQLLGHELTHVIQQRAGRARHPFLSGVSVIHDPVLEAEAERLGILAAANSIGSSRPSSHGRGMRQGSTPHTADAHRGDGVNVSAQTSAEMPDSPAQTSLPAASAKLTTGCIQQVSISDFNWSRSTPFTTLFDWVSHRTTQSEKDIWDMRRWRLNPINIIAGFTNLWEEEGNYHTNSRHGAHNTIRNIANRRNRRMVDMYNSPLLGGYTYVKRAKRSGRFNSESWESYSWRKAKEIFEGIMPSPVTWIRGPLVGYKTCHLRLRFAGEDVGVSIEGDAETEVDSVHVAINYQNVGGSIEAYNGQMYPISHTVLPEAGAHVYKLTIPWTDRFSW